MACGSLLSQTSWTSRHCMKPSSWFITASITPSRIAFATICSVSSTESRDSFFWISRSDIFEYEMFSFFRPNFRTVCFKREIKEQFLSAEKIYSYFISTFLNVSMSPDFTQFTIQKYGDNGFWRKACENIWRLGISPIKSSTMTCNF